VSNPKVQVAQKSDPSTKPQSVKKVAARTFSQDEIRTRAYQIYESRNRTDATPDGDWFQAEIELMELVASR